MFDYEIERPWRISISMLQMFFSHFNRSHTNTNPRYYMHVVRLEVLLWKSLCQTLCNIYNVIIQFSL